jgi:UDP-N-acetylglucosamine--N-acetylmuramyl-(pentapeptide) pyrophosphoryl-undecaprenol N-acetylglucosamine transferase
MTTKRVLIMAGGTGGHIFPALAVADELRAAGVEVHWLGTAQGLEEKIIPKANIPLHHIRISGLRRSGKLALLTVPFKLLLATWQALRIMIKLKPQAILGMGGFVSGPGGIAAFLLRKKLVIHEQNAIVGFTNRQLAKIARRVFQAYANTFASKYQPQTIGNPVRQSLLNLPTPAERYAKRDNALRILVIGGSQGAHTINECLQATVTQLAGKIPFILRHQTGKADQPALQAYYQQHNLNANALEFIDDMAEAYAWADVIICRAGALTIAEIMAVGIPSILIPFPFAVDDHQTYNAQPLVANGAAILIQQTELTPARLVTILIELQQQPQRLLDMANAAYNLRKANATKDVAEYLRG